MNYYIRKQQISAWHYTLEDDENNHAYMPFTFRYCYERDDCIREFKDVLWVDILSSSNDDMPPYLAQLMCTGGEIFKVCGIYTYSITK